MELIDPIVEINGEKYVLWHSIDEYKVNSSVHATPLKEWEKLQEEYGEFMEDTYVEFVGIFQYPYEDLKENIEIMLEEE